MAGISTQTPGMFAYWLTVSSVIQSVISDWLTPLLTPTWPGACAHGRCFDWLDEHPETAQTFPDLPTCMSIISVYVRSLAIASCCGLLHLFASFRRNKHETIGMIGYEVMLGWHHQCLWGQYTSWRTNYFTGLFQLDCMEELGASWEEKAVACDAERLQKVRKVAFLHLAWLRCGWK